MVKRSIAAGDFIAELYFDYKSAPPVYHYIVTRKDSADILAWGQELSAEEAERAAFEEVSFLSTRLTRGAQAG